MPTVIIESSEHDGEVWHVRARIETAQGVGVGTHIIALPATATPAALLAYIQNILSES